MTVSEPLKEIVNKPAEAKELYLAKKGFNTLQDFDRFINLEVLWLNNNLITEVVNLDACTRIRKLYLQDNKITTLAGSISKFKFLEVLLIHNNLLRDLHSVLDQLVHHRHLKQLNLLGNPCAEEEGYREIVISRLPLLEIFDRHVVTAKERALADQTLKKAPQLFRTTSKPNLPDAPVSAKKTKPGTKTELLVEKEAQRIRTAALQREQIVQQQQQQELESQLASTKRQTVSDHLPLPEALDFLKQRQLNSSTSLSPSSSPSPSPSPSSTLILPPITHSRSPAKQIKSETSTKSLRSEISSDLNTTSENLQKSSFRFETFSYYTKDQSQNLGSTNGSSASPYKTTSPRSPPPRVTVHIK